MTTLFFYLLIAMLIIIVINLAWLIYQHIYINRQDDQIDRLQQQVDAITSHNTFLKRQLHDKDLEQKLANNLKPIKKTKIPVTYEDETGVYTNEAKTHMITLKDQSKQTEDLKKLNK